MKRFRAAPWPTSLKATSFAGSAILIAVGYALAYAVPTGTRAPYAESFGALIAWIPPLVGAAALLFVVRGYELAPGELRVRRLLWSTRVALAGPVDARADAQAMTGSMRLFGNGGLFSFTGLFQSRTLGRYRAFVTDPARAVVLRTARRVVIVSPAEPQSFVEAVQAFT
ncbi:MAG TPA: PH domain-containing protein [Burkholderiales bacterium]|nr:PH domain-containing protein [Burkholderiales bacterium]